MAAIVSLASAKGGVGKSSAAVAIGAELALHRGLRVAILDADRNQHAARFGARCAIPDFTVAGEIDERNVLAAIRAAHAVNDVVFIDLAGGASTLALKAMQRSHFVLIPAQMSLPDAQDAIATLDQVDDAGELNGTAIDRAILWSRVRHGFEARPVRKVRETVEANGVPIFNARIMDRASFVSMFVAGQALSQLNPADPAVANVLAVADELLARLEKSVGAAAG